MKQMLITLSLLLVPFIVSAKDIDVKEAQELMKNKEIIILDVRTPNEFSSGHIENAVNIDIYSNDFANNVQNLDKNKEYIIYCRSGARSKSAENYLNSIGIKNTYNVLGGMNSWQQNNLPTVK